jgi:gas vesicle protein
VEKQDAVQDSTIPSKSRSEAFGYLMAGIGIGVAVSMILVPRSGTETRLRIANRVLNGIDTTNEKVRQTRLRVMDVMDRGQAVGKLKMAAN